MNVIDAEYQYDRTKLSIYYVSDVRIDFREIVRHVFSTFQTRIWMKKSNRELSFEPIAYAVAALATGVAPNKTTLYRGDLGRGVGTPYDNNAAVGNSGGGGVGSGGGNSSGHGTLGAYSNISGGSSSSYMNANGGF